MYPDFPIVNPVAFVVPSVKVVGNVDEVSTDDVVNAVVLILDRTLQFAPTLPIVIVPAFVPPIANVPELLTASIDGVNKLVFTFVVPKIVKLLPWILPVADIVALDTAPDAVNELPEIAPVVVSVVPVIAPDEDTVAPDKAPVAVMLLPDILPVVEIDGSVIVLLNTTGDLKVVIIVP